MSFKSNVELMADYNQWMNRSVYNAASRLTAVQLNEDRGAFFGSIIATLNHILVGDTIWLKRFACHPSNLISLQYVRELNQPSSLDAVLYTEFSSLLEARKAMDMLIIQFAHELTEDVLASSFTYTNTKGDVFTKNFGHLIQHFFNHQTHHRGQVSTLLSQAGIDIGTTDLLVNIPNA
jgi:uncharacterized damage-inducible protein DinB